MNGEPADRKRRWARVLLTIAGVLGVWALIVASAGGIRYDLGPIRISSRDPVRPMLLVLLFVCAAWRIAYVDWLDQQIARLAPHRRFIELGLVSVAAGFVFILTITFGVRAAGGSDSFGYLSEAALWLRGDLHVDQSFAASMPWYAAEEGFAPLGYRPAAAHTMVPTYAPGLPLLMAGARLIGVCGPYLVGPVCGAILVVLTYLVGRKYLSHTAALIGTLLTAGSPTVLYMAMFPMSDVPAAMFWLAALFTASSRALPGAVVTGVLTGIAVAIRPNLAPLSFFPWVLLIVSSRRTSPPVLKTVAFIGGLLPFVALVATVNRALYGSSLASGYGPLGSLFSVEYLLPNVSRFVSWWLQSQGLLCLLFLLSLRPGLLKRGQTFVLVAFAAAVVLLYAFYTPFDVWWFLRFLLPAIPIALLLCAEAVRWLTSKSPSRVAIALFAFFVLTLVHVIDFSQHHGLLDPGDDEHRYADAGLFIDQVTHPNAVIITDQHSGSIRYYSGRLTLRFHWLSSDWLDRAIDRLEAEGRPVYLFIERWEEPTFRQRFAGQRSVSVLDHGPRVASDDGRMLFYAVNGAPVNGDFLHIPRTSRFECRDISPGFWTAAARNQSNR